MKQSQSVRWNSSSPTGQVASMARIMNGATTMVNLSVVASVYGEGLIIALYTLAEMQIMDRRMTGIVQTGKEEKRKSRKLLSGVRIVSTILNVIIGLKMEMIGSAQMEKGLIIMNDRKEVLKELGHLSETIIDPDNAEKKYVEHLCSAAVWFWDAFLMPTRKEGKESNGRQVPTS